MTFSLGNHDMLGLSEEAIKTFWISKDSLLQSYASCLFGLVWLQFCSCHLSPKTSPNQKSILVWQTPPTNGIWSSHYPTSVARAGTRAHASRPTPWSSPCTLFLIVSFSCATLILNALMLSREPSLSWTVYDNILSKRWFLVIATIECQQQPLTTSPIIPDL